MKKKTVKKNDKQSRSLRSVLPPFLIEEYKETVEMDDLFQKKMEEVLDVLKITPEELEKKIGHLNDLENVSNSQKKMLEEKMLSLQQQLSLIADPLKETKKKEEQRKKMGVGQKRKWIPVR